MELNQLTIHELQEKNERGNDPTDIVQSVFRRIDAVERITIFC